jgi:two-component system CheB/CheR fusion protein
VFEMFRQQDAATTRDEGGLGIGLALVKSLVELHGGRVKAESAGRGRGTTIRVWLPMHQPTEFGELDEAEEDQPPRTIAGSRVLLVDDTSDTLETFGYLLEHEGARVTPASSGTEALALAEAEDFDLVISDVGMPGMDGYELITELRKRPRTAGLPAIALTGHGRSEDIGRALQAGFNAHVGKPVDFARMRAAMAAVLAGAPIAGKAPDPR